MRIILIFVILLWGAFSHASPPCGIPYTVVDVSTKAESVFSKFSVRNDTVGEGLSEIHIKLPNELTGAKIGGLSLTVGVGDTPSLVVNVDPYYRDSSHSSYVINVHEDLMPQVNLAVVYNFYEKCGEEEVVSKGFRYHLEKP